MTTTASPFHRGEAQVQERLGVRDEIEPWARKVVRNQLPDQHRAFYSELPFLVIAARDRRGRPWVTLVSGAPGFVHSSQPDTLEVDALPAPGDALDGAIDEHVDIGALGIELHTRRRNRVNGRVSARGDGGFSLGVEQAFGNCPQYIHERNWQRAPVDSHPPAQRLYREFSTQLRKTVESADTFFIASGHRGEGESPTFGMDASHRGGEPGFVRVVGSNTLLFPDYAGNNHFNTLGNLMLEPHAGLLFVDFERGDTLQLTGRAFVEWEHPEIQSFPGARRLIRFELDAAVQLRGVLPLRFDAGGEAVRELRLIDKVPESDEVTSFVFESRDGAALANFSAGQHLPIELEIAGHGRPVKRTYSLSNRPADDVYRITVKRESHGLVSRHLHDHLDVGHIASARPPRGDFTLAHEGSHPIVLASAGVGLTPMVSMLHELVENGAGRNVWFVHGARDGRHHPLANEVRQVAETSTHVRVHVAYSRPRADDLAGYDYHSTGRVNATLLEKLVPGRDADYYLCGPTGFMAAIQQQLEERGVSGNRIYTESFGPTG